MRLHDVCAYEILGLTIGEVYGPEDIKKAYKRASLKAHPDKHEGDSEPFLVLKEAWHYYRLRVQFEVHLYVQYGQMHLPIHHPLLSGGGGMCLPILH